MTTEQREWCAGWRFSFHPDGWADESRSEAWLDGYYAGNRAQHRGARPGDAALEWRRRAVAND